MLAFKVSMHSTPGPHSEKHIDSLKVLQPARQSQLKPAAIESKTKSGAYLPQEYPIPRDLHIVLPSHKSHTLNLTPQEDHEEM